MKNLLAGTGVGTVFVVLDEDLQALSPNRAFCRIFQAESDEAVRHALYDLCNHSGTPQPCANGCKTSYLGTPRSTNEATHESEQSGRRTMVLNACRILGKAGQTRLILLATEGITERPRAEEA